MNIHDTQAMIDRIAANLDALQFATSLWHSGLLKEEKYTYPERWFSHPDFPAWQWSLAPHESGDMLFGDGPNNVAIELRGTEHSFSVSIAAVHHHND